MRKVLLLLGGLLAALWISGERGNLILPSTKKMIKEGGWRYVLSTRFWHAYFYGRWTNQYIGWSVKYVLPNTHPIPNNNQWADEYHGKVIPTELAKALVSVNEPICLKEMGEQLIPYPTARNLILEASPEIVAYECGCRHSRENPCQPTQVCMIVGQPWVDFVMEHNPDSSRKLTREEAVQLLEEEHQRGHMHAAYFKDVMHERFYAICNCCKCCCAGLESMRHGVPMVISSGYVAQVNAAQCKACRTCEHACPFEAIHVNGAAAVNWEKCMGCGVCEGQCPNGAISLVLDDRKGQPLDVRTLGNS